MKLNRGHRSGSSKDQYQRSDQRYCLRSLRKLFVVDQIVVAHERHFVVGLVAGSDAVRRFGSSTLVA